MQGSQENISVRNEEIEQRVREDKGRVNEPKERNRETITPCKSLSRAGSDFTHQNEADVIS